MTPFCRSCDAKVCRVWSVSSLAALMARRNARGTFAGSRSPHASDGKDSVGASRPGPAPRQYTPKKNASDTWIFSIGTSLAKRFGTFAFG